jgi:hypothetical protein
VWERIESGLPGHILGLFYPGNNTVVFSLSGNSLKKTKLSIRIYPDAAEDRFFLSFVYIFLAHRGTFEKFSNI